MMIVPGMCQSHTLEEPHFNCAQTILMQIAAALAVEGVPLNSMVTWDENRVVFLCQWHARVLALPLHVGMGCSSLPCDYVIFPKPDISFYRSLVQTTMVAGLPCGCD
eukprot:11475646-Alexandrium_andersonii.AAC.1